MFRLVVLSVLVAVAAAAPVYLHTVPVATSHQERVDVIDSSPVLTQFSAPAVELISIDHSEDLQDYDDSHIYEQDSHDIHLASPFVDSIVVAAPETIKTISSHHEVHQIHDAPVEEINIVDVLSAPDFESVAVEDIPSFENHPEVHDTPIVYSLPIIHSEEDVHHIDAPLISSVESVESHHEIHQVHDSPVVHSIVAPIVASHEDVHHEIPLLHAVETVVPVAVSHSSRTDVHQDSVVAVPAVHAW